MLTIFACPKPFTDPQIAAIQRSALASWTLLCPRPEIIVFGKEDGIDSLCAELAVHHVRDVHCNTLGTPLVNELFARAQELAAHELVCYVNADLILMQDFIAAVARVARRFRRFFFTGRRWHVGPVGRLDSTAAAWAETLQAQLRDPRPGRDDAIDYLVFPRGELLDIPPFALGRLAWDNWLVWRAAVSGLPLVDASSVVSAIHQDHAYDHMGGFEAISAGVEAERNRYLARDGAQHGTLLDATHILTARGLWPGWPRRVAVRLHRAAREWVVYRAGPVRRRLGLRRQSFKRLRTRLRTGVRRPATSSSQKPETA